MERELEIKELQRSIKNLTDSLAVEHSKCNMLQQQLNERTAQLEHLHHEKHFMFQEHHRKYQIQSDQIAMLQQRLNTAHLTPIRTDDSLTLTPGENFASGS